VKSDAPHILLINPWIHDFAAYDFWAKPFGLLGLAAVLRSGGFRVTYIDCLDRFHPLAPKTDPAARYGRGPYIKTRIPKPERLKDIPRHFSRYGVKTDWFRHDLAGIVPPDLIMVTSLMTYWYPGVFHTIRLLREIFPDTPIFLGGIYATLCHNHADEKSGADRVVAGSSIKEIIDLVQDQTLYSAIFNFDPDDLESRPYPAFDLQRTINYVPLLTSLGCPLSCTYCASNLLHPKRTVRSPEAVVAEIDYWHETYGVVDFVFYDDALLVRPEKHIMPILEGILKKEKQIRFHTPNALHIGALSLPLARLMFDAGFETIRIGLETTLFEDRGKIDGKVSEDEFRKGIDHLLKAGFQRNQIGAYLLVGLPDQQVHDVAESILTVKNAHITPVPAYYSPIPRTKMWARAVASSRYDLEADPIYTNNAILPCQKEPFSWEALSRLKSMAATD
jgi:radical SAM superfamily enzyme YgiQ (UPF0313 family)